MDSFTQPIEYCVTYNKESPEALLRLGKKLQEFDLFWHSFTEAAELYSNTTISDMSNYILPDTIDVTSRIEMVLSLVSSEKLQNCPAEMPKLFFTMKI